MVAMPAVSHSPIGEKGIFDAKNTAGTLGMLTVVTMGVSLFLFRAWLARASLAAVYLLSWVFLVATKSKTSLGVAAIMTAAGPLLYTLLSRGGASASWRCSRPLPGDSASSSPASRSASRATT